MSSIVLIAWLILSAVFCSAWIILLSPLIFSLEVGPETLIAAITLFDLVIGRATQVKPYSASSLS